MPSPEMGAYCVVKDQQTSQGQVLQVTLDHGVWLLLLSVRDANEGFGQGVAGSDCSFKESLKGYCIEDCCHSEWKQGDWGGGCCRKPGEAALGLGQGRGGVDHASGQVWTLVKCCVWRDENFTTS